MITYLAILFSNAFTFNSIFVILVSFRVELEEQKLSLNKLKEQYKEELVQQKKNLKSKEEVNQSDGNIESEHKQIN